ncbi:MAG: DPP IV N-terminal domain-containing protein, partial [Thermoanaerobaculia bacterium]|nr:DPP IV N-terminal domain-containing protein [Thermoanaerobaculia bacterium]
WSPDSRTLAFFAEGAIRKLDVQTGTIQTVCECATSPRGGSWHENGGILFAPNPNAGLSSIAASGGTAQIVTKVDPAIPDASHRYPQWLPDGRHFIFTLWSNSAVALKSHGGIYLASIDGKTPPRKLLNDASSATFVEPGWVLVRRNEAMVAVSFDPKSFTIGSEVVPVDANAMFESNIGALIASASKRGDIAWNVGSGTPPTKLVWLGRDGSEISELDPEGNWGELAISPDGQRVALTRVEGSSATQIWIRELARNTLTPLTRTVNDSYSAVWSPDGDRIAFVNRDSGNEEIFVQSVASTVPAQRIHSNPDHDYSITDWSKDGNLIFLDASAKTREASREVWVWDFSKKKARQVLADAFSQSGAKLSPDGRWLAYWSAETGTREIFIRPWPALDRKWMVSSGGGLAAHWSRDGRELTIVSPAESGFTVSAVSLEPDASSPNPSVPRKLAGFDSRVSELVPTADHQHYLAIRTIEADEPSGIRAILGWSRALGQRETK